MQGWGPHPEVSTSTLLVTPMALTHDSNLGPRQSQSRRIWPPTYHKSPKPLESPTNPFASSTSAPAPDVSPSSYTPSFPPKCEIYGYAAWTSPPKLQISQQRTSITTSGMGTWEPAPKSRYPSSGMTSSITATKHGGGLHGIF